MSFYSLLQSKTGNQTGVAIRALILAILGAGILGTLYNEKINDAERISHMDSAKVLASAGAIFVERVANNGAFFGTNNLIDGIPVQTLTAEIDWDADGPGQASAMVTSAKSDFVLTLDSLRKQSAVNPYVLGGLDPSQVSVSAGADEPGYSLNGTAIHVKLICTDGDEESVDGPCHTKVAAADGDLEPIKVIGIQARVNLIGGDIEANKTVNFNADLSGVDKGATTYTGALKDGSQASKQFYYLKMFDGTDGSTDLMGNPILFVSNDDIYGGSEASTKLVKVPTADLEETFASGGKLTVKTSAFLSFTSNPNHFSVMNIVSPLDMGQLKSTNSDRELIDTSGVDTSTGSDTGAFDG